MHTQENTHLAVKSMEAFLFGYAPKPVRCGRGIEIGAGQVLPEINFTLPPIDINPDNWPKVREHYSQMIEGVCQRAVDLEVPGLVVEFETLPPMTVNPEWGKEITQLLSEVMRNYHEKYGLKNALRLTPNDTREHERPPLMRRGKYWEGMCQLFEAAAPAGADLLAIESTGGKEICDEALMNADLTSVVFALGVLGARDMAFLWQKIVNVCEGTNVVPSGDTACGFGNTAMVLAEQKMIPRVFAAVVRAATVPRSLVAYTMGAVGPSKDCAYEGPYMKAIAGIPISMEGKSAACAHLSPVGNVAQAVCDCWSNESVQNVKLLSASAPVVSLEQLAYDCRLMNTAMASSKSDACRLRDWLADSDAALDPQAYVLKPDIVLEISEKIISETDPYLQTRCAVHAAIKAIREGIAADRLHLPERELRWLDKLEKQADALPEDESILTEKILQSPQGAKCLPEEYGIAI